MQQLRTVVSFTRDEQGNAISGAMKSPDMSSRELPLSELQLVADGSWSFKITNPDREKSSAKYSGKQTSADQVSGEFEQAGEKVVLNLQRIDSMPIETTRDLGADVVWTGTLDLVAMQRDFRIRVYLKPPYASADAPRYLFDSLSQKAPGIPALFSKGADGKTIFEMKTIGVKFSGTLNEAGNELDGRFAQGTAAFKLVLKRQLSTIQSPNATTKNKEMHPSEESLDAAKQEGERKNPLILDGESVPAIAKSAIVSTEHYDEAPFEVTYGAKPKKGKEAASSQPGIKLTGTITIPKPKDKGRPRKFPAVVMVTGSGPQDRNETIGRHKPFETIAHYLAENGIASLRYDDRGVGQSTGDFYSATTEDFAKDAIAIWKHAKTLVELDPLKIGMLGHSEGGVVGTIAAVWEPEIAFLILIAPPGVNGSEILKSQIDRISELQGMSESDRKATMALQSRLQDIASGYFSDESTMRRDIQNAIRQNWEGLKSMALSQDANTNLDDLKKALSEQIEGQFQQLRMPWYRFFLNYEPSTNWMMIRCPTLAIWGSNDVQILPELNRNNLQIAIERNRDIEAQLTIVPGLNHLLQTSSTGLPAEYDEIDESISPTALEIIRSWALSRGIINE